MQTETTEMTQEYLKIQTSDILSENNPDAKAKKMQYFAQQSRIDVFDMIRKRQNGHWGGSSSAAEILTTLYFHIMNIDPAHPGWDERDRLVLSKGHAAPMLYHLLAHRGYFPVDDLKKFRELNSHLQGHPSMLKTPGVEMSTGALGHGMSVSVGMALAAALNRKKYWTFVIMGDGCLNEGQTWEGIMAAAKFQPARLAILIDYNKVQLDGSADEIMSLEPLPDKFNSFNLKTAEKIYDGHKVTDILESWDWMQQNQGKPCVVIYKTHKGNGISFTKDNHKWHGAPIDDESYEKGRPELVEGLKSLEIQGGS
jgi:transketolase